MNTTKAEKEYYSLNDRAFSLLAPIYDIIALPIAGVRSRVVEMAGAKTGSNILEVATGTGSQALVFGELGHKVVGIDISEAMLRIARRKNRLAKVSFENADAAQLPFADGSFNVSCVSFALHEMPPSIRERVMREMVRVTGPGGAVLVADYGLPTNRAGRALVYALIRLFESPYYPEFVRSDLKAWLGTFGVEVQAESSVLLGVGRVLKGIKIRQPT